MQPWIVDAKDITDLSTITQFDKGLLISSPAIQSFLSPAGMQTNIVSGPKGFGKTLLLKLKRQSLIERGYSYIPEDQLVDKPVGVPTIVSRKSLGPLLNSTQYWKQVWEVAISIAVLKKEGTSVSGLKCSVLSEIFIDNLLTSPCDIFDCVLSLTRKQFSLALEDLRRVLVPNIRNISSQFALFIDNVDEYFESAASYAETESLLATGDIQLWVFAQCGLVSAAREINGVNNHIKCWVSIRSEAMEYLIANDPMAAQVGGSTVSLRYSKTDLVKILQKNIANEEDNRLFQIGTDEFERFFGLDAMEIENTYVAESEAIVDYVLRHTLSRPRDIAIIGKAISDIPPSRRTEEHVSQTINERATFIAQTYLAEARVHTPGFRPDILFSLITSNTLTLKDLSRISYEYDAVLNQFSGETVQRHPFCTLYRLGLLGIVKKLGGNRAAYQSFPAPGEVGFLTENVLPSAPFYLVHPVLVGLISRRNKDFLNNIDPLNIVGNDRRWHAINDVDFVFKGDVVGYSKIMADPDLAPRFPDIFCEVVERAKSNNGVFAEISGGDSILLQGKVPEKLVSAVHDIRHDMLKSLFEAKLRFAGDAGLMRFRDDGTGPQISGGKSIRVAARLEPKVKEDWVVVTDRFQYFCEQQRQSRFKRPFKMIELASTDLPEVPSQDGQFNLAKNDVEPAILHRLYRLRR
ncbi:hypothetical protein BD293_4046 [Roseinatronobacter monicus]|uniref:Uncharacterized protein n=2 Tax=Roseinatronobacter monicus TaxID=393481 RepID=A0A543K4X2_9RHOB|nr:hypothetical protein BD293_4046 [Roseinatronobacter monicus]